MAFVPPSCTPASLVGRAVARPSLCLPRRHSRRFRHQPCTVAALLPNYWVRSCAGGAWAEHALRFRTHVWTELSCWQMRTFTETPQLAVGVPPNCPRRCRIASFERMVCFGSGMIGLGRVTIDRGALTVV